MNDTAVIINLTEQSWTLHRSYGTFQVPGVAPSAIAGQVLAGPRGEAYSRTLVTGRTALMDLGDKRTL